MPRPPGLVIFDCDGVLVDSETISSRVLAEAITALGWPLTPGEAEQRFRGESMDRVAAAVDDQVGRTLGSDWLLAFRDSSHAAFRAELIAIDGAAEAVRGVKAIGWEVCVASQARVTKMQLTLGITGLIELFEPDRLFSASMVAHPKPAPDLFAHAARTCGFDPADCVVVEDSTLGVRGAKAAGMYVIGYGGDELTAAGADTLIGDMRDVVRTVNCEL
jgi:beta-phosphoglucomutase-like phosphatase (HAD superfamily)